MNTIGTGSTADMDATRPKVITLCGSLRFRDIFESVQKRLTLEGCIVLCPLLPAPVAPPLSEEQIALLRKLHLQRIDMADEVLVINADGYIGSQTQKEIEYARSKGKKITYLEVANT